MSETHNRRSIFFDLRGLLGIIVLTLLAYHHTLVPAKLWLLGIGLLVSDLLILFLPVSWLETPELPYAVFLVDSGFLTIFLYTVSGIESESLLLYYLTVFMATLGQDLRKSVGIAVVVGGLQIWLRLRVSGNVLRDPETLTRIALFFVTAIMCSYLAQQVGSQRRRVRKLREAQTGLEAEIDRYAGDLTESEQLRATAEASERRYRLLFERNLAGVFRSSLEGRLLECNDSLAHIFGYATRQEILARETLECFVDPANHQTNLARLREQGALTNLELHLRRKDGTPVWVLINASVVEDIEGTPAALEGTLIDITERKQAEEALRASEERYRIVAETATDAIITVDQESTILFVNPAAEKIFGYTMAEMLGQQLTMLMPEYLRHVHKAGIKRYVETGKRHISWDAIALPGLHKAGHEIPLEISFGELIKNGKRIFTGIVRDITERKRAQDALLQLAAIVESSDDAIIGKTVDGIITSWNSGAEKMYGYSANEVMGHPISILAPPDRHDETAQILERLRAGEHIHHLETVRIRKDGRQIEVALTISPVRDAAGQLIGASTIARETTERKQLEAQLRQAQKMEAVGRLAGGVAHDFNNLLTIITGYSQLLLGQLGANEPFRWQLEEIQKAGDRAVSLTRQLLAFSRRQVLAPQMLDLNAVVANTEKMLRRLIGEDIELITVPGAGLGMVKADPGQIEQVIMNLAVNARDAMPQGGKLTIETANADLDEAYARTHLPVIPGSYVMLAMSDTGVGMDAETQSHCFEPFFTTKEPGKGTGLGLATVYGIVKQSGGNIWVYSEPGRGATFKMYLPQVEAPARAFARAAESASALRGAETVLLVEDEEALRRLARGILEGSGYKVLEAGGGDEALQLGAQHQGPIHLMLTDVVMPGLSGRELAERLAALHPESKILYMSGYTDDAVVRHGILAAGTAFLQKPFAPETLARKVREVLDN